MPDDKNYPNEDTHNTSLKHKLEPYKGSGQTLEAGQEDLNSTQMGIDVSVLQAETKANIQVELSVSEKETPPTFFETYTSRLKSFFNKKRDKQQVSSPSYETHDENTPADFILNLSNTRGLWLAPFNLSFVQKVFFYFSRLYILVGFGLLHVVLGALLLNASNHKHQSLWVFVVALSLSIIGSILALFKKASPAWLMGLPLAALGFVMGFGLFFYGGFDTYYYSLQGHTLSNSLNSYFLILYGFVALLYGAGLGSTAAGSVMWALIVLLSLMVPLLNHMQGLSLEDALRGAGFFSKIKIYYAQPAYLMLSVLGPLWLLLVFIKSFSSSKKKQQALFVSVYRCFLVVFLSVCFLSFGVLQNQRLFHVLNFVFPAKTFYTKAEFEINGHKVLIKTKSGLEEASFYATFKMVPSSQGKQFECQILDESKNPITNIQPDDLNVFIDGIESRDYQFLPHPSKENTYLFKMELKVKNQVIALSENKKVWQDFEKIVVDVQDPQNVSRIVLYENGQSLLEKTQPFAERVDFDLTYFDKGDHAFSIVAFGMQNEELIKLPLKITLQESQSLIVLSPFMQDDVVGDEVLVALALKGIDAQKVNHMQLYLNDQRLHESFVFIPQIKLDAKDQAPGILKLRIEVTTDQKTFTQNLDLKKQSAPLPVLDILSPLQGSFAPNETEIQYALSQNTSHQILGVKVQVNGFDFSNFEVKDHRFILPTALWKGTEIFMALQVTLDSGQKVSDWVQINRGKSGLKVSFAKENSYLNLNTSPWVLVMDASQNAQDYWHGKSFFDSQAYALLSPEIQGKLGVIKNWQLLGTGSDKPSYYKSCDSFFEMAQSTDVAKNSLKKKIDELKPNGPRTLFYTLEKALKQKPAQILILTNGLDECKNDFVNELENLTKLYPEPKITLIGASLDLSPEQNEKLSRLLNQSGGALYLPEDNETFVKDMSEALSLNMELLGSEKLIEKVPFKDSEWTLPPGAYKIRVPFEKGFKDLPLTLKHGFKTELKISSQEGKMLVEENQISF